MPHATPIVVVADPLRRLAANSVRIGLSISRSIIESHEGQLRATTNDGPGATFSFSIPDPTGPSSDGWSLGTTVLGHKVASAFNGS